MAEKPPFLQHRTLIDKWTTWRLFGHVIVGERIGDVALTGKLQVVGGEMGAWKDQNHS